MVEVDNLSKRYGDTFAVQNLTFQARDGEILGFLGKNGAGKTTTMRIMTGFMHPTRGTVRVEGHDIREESLKARRLIGYLPETAPLYEDMSVTGYLSFCARLREVPAAEVANRVDTVMRSVRIDERRNWIIGKLSKGLRRRVGLAQALVHNPRVLILDEPTEGLDPEQIIEIRKLILGLRGDHTVILSTHILSEAQMLADRIVIIHEGKLVAVDTTENLAAAVQSMLRLRVEAAGPAAEVRQLLQALPGVQRIEQIEGPNPRFVVETERNVDLREQISRLIVGAGWPLLELERLEPTLEDVFLSLTQQKASAPAPAEEESAEPEPTEPESQPDADEAAPGPDEDA